MIYMVEDQGLAEVCTCSNTYMTTYSKVDEFMIIISDCYDLIVRAR